MKRMGHDVWGIKNCHMDKKTKIKSISIMWIGAVVAVAISYFFREEPSFKGPIIPIVILYLVIGHSIVLFKKN